MGYQIDEVDGIQTCSSNQPLASVLRDVLHRRAQQETRRAQLTAVRARTATIKQKCQRSCKDAEITHGDEAVVRSTSRTRKEALARETRRLGFASTYSTTYLAPYHTAKVFSTLDHLTGGRVAWNVVTSYLRDAEKNGLGTLLPHDERYDRAEEYMQVVYKLWEASWEEGAMAELQRRGAFGFSV